MEDAIVQKVDDEYVSIYSDSEIFYINKVGELVSNTEVFKDAKLYTYKAQMMENGDLQIIQEK